MEDLWEIMSKSPRKREEQPGRHGYEFDEMGYALPKANDQDALEAIRLVTDGHIEFAQVIPLGAPKARSHQNCADLASHFGGQWVRGFKVEVTANGVLEMTDHSVIRVSDRLIDVTPFYNKEQSCFVTSTMELQEVEEPILNPLRPDYGQLANAKPSFFMPLSEQAQRVMIQRMEMVGKKVRQRDVRDASKLNRHNILVIRY
jgi:hypothetical protein